MQPTSLQLYIAAVSQRLYLDLMVKDRLVSYVQEMGVSQGGILALVSFSIKLTLTSGTYVSLHARVLKI